MVGQHDRIPTAMPFINHADNEIQIRFALDALRLLLAAARTAYMIVLCGQMVSASQGGLWEQMAHDAKSFQRLARPCSDALAWKLLVGLMRRELDLAIT